MTIKNLIGLGQDLISSGDNNIITSSNYKTDASLIGFKDTFIAEYKLSDILFDTVTIKGDSSKTTYKENPSLMQGDTGA